MRERYIPFFEVEEVDSGTFKAVYKGKTRYFDVKDDAEKYEKEGQSTDKIAQAKDDEEKKKAHELQGKNDDGSTFDRKLGDVFKSHDGKSVACIYDVIKGVDGKKDKFKTAYFTIDDYKTEGDAIQAAQKKVKDAKPSLIRDIFGSKDKGKKTTKKKK